MIEQIVRDFKDVFVNHMIIQNFTIILLLLLQSERLAMVSFSETSLWDVQILLHNCS